MSEAGEIVGMVDVLKLTYATLDQINSMGTTDSEGPAWNKFWLSLENESESMVSGEGSRMPHTPDHRSLMSPAMDRPGMDRGDSVLPNESASHHGDSPPHSAVAGAIHSPIYEDEPFAFKFKAPSGRVHRLHITPSAGIDELVSSVADKLGKEIDAVGGLPEVEEGKLGKTGFALSYLDNEGDTVSITTDKDILEAITLARQIHREKVDLFVHDPDQPPHSATLDPHPTPKPPSPPESALRQRRRFEEEEDEEAAFEERSKREKKQTAPLQQEQFVAGVPNELLLPGAIVTLAVVIVGVFALTRTGNR
jgi:hypothetical protein